MNDDGAKFDCRYCRLEWLKNNDKLQNSDELIKYKYVCVKNNSITPALNLNGKFICKFSDWNNGKKYLANVYKYNEKTKPEYVCVHPKLLDLSTDFMTDCIENHQSIMFEIKEQESEKETNIITNDNQNKIVKSGKPTIKIIKAESVLDKLKKNKKLYYILIGSVVIGVISLILTFFL